MSVFLRRFLLGAIAATISGACGGSDNTAPSSRIKPIIENIQLFAEHRVDLVPNPPMTVKVIKSTDGKPFADIPITATITTGFDRGEFVGNTTAITDSNGIARFSGLSIHGEAGVYDIQFSAKGEKDTAVKVKRTRLLTAPAVPIDRLGYEYTSTTGRVRIIPYDINGDVIEIAGRNVSWMIMFSDVEQSLRYESPSLVSSALTDKQGEINTPGQQQNPWAGSEPGWWWVKEKGSSDFAFIRVIIRAEVDGKTVEIR